jgi:putative ABC transport system permease protein
MVGAALMAQTVWQVARVDVGFAPEHVLSASPSYPHGWREPTIYLPVTDRILREIRQLPGVATGALRAPVPLAPRNGIVNLTLDGSADPMPPAQVPTVSQSISPEYFNTLHIPVLAGRDFTEHDRDGALAVAIVNQWAAERWWPGQDPVGRTVRIENGTDPALSITVVGVVANNKAAQPGLLFAQDGPELYRPYLQAPTAFPVFFARAQDRAEALVGPARELLVRLVPDRPVFSALLSLNVAQQFAGVRRNALQIAGFAAIGLFLALVGVYGVLSFDVGRRTRELGIRGALGASGPGIVRLVLTDAVRLTAIGVLLGIPMALAATGLLDALLFQTRRANPLLYVAVVVCVAAVSLCAAYLPAQRAARFSPMIALRGE